MNTWVTGRKPGTWLFFDRPGNLFCGASPRLSSFRREYDVTDLTFNFVLQQYYDLLEFNNELLNNPVHVQTNLQDSKNKNIENKDLHFS